MVTLNAVHEPKCVTRGPDGVCTSLVGHLEKLCCVLNDYISVVGLLEHGIMRFLCGEHVAVLSLVLQISTRNSIPRTHFPWRAAMKWSKQQDSQYNLPSLNTIEV